MFICFLFICFFFFIFLFFFFVCCFQVSPPATRSAQALGSLQPDLGMTNRKLTLGRERERDGLINRSRTATAATTENAPPPHSPQTWARKASSAPLSRTLAALGDRGEGWAHGAAGPPKKFDRRGRGGAAVRADRGPRGGLRRSVEREKNC